ncbi:cytochrome c [Aliiroseovarius subalbicans]|uniref:cytochrome c n=1 Tax=Aliiroseovarius subalbicans TaxID=2925840 RepID=UPI001F5A633A|nr:cytochrome c [Aliiroseovarius subalbicans]MCI2401094.1 cytochrome c [Aliiroseovarius subalbicans]
MRFAILAAALAIPTATFAADPAADAIAARQGYFKLVGANMGVLAGMAQGKMDYDAAKAQKAADNMAVLASYDLSHTLLPDTTAEAMGDKTRLKQVAFDDLEGFVAAYTKFAAAAGAMQAVAGAGQGELGGAMGALGGSCKGCHDEYRTK